MARKLVFGVFPLGLAGMENEVASGAPDDPTRIAGALRTLQGDGSPLIQRTYVLYTGPDSTETVLGQVAAYVDTGVAWDLVLCFRDPGINLEPWLDLISAIVQRYGSKLACLKITAETNLANVPASGDGAQPAARQALITGIQAAHAAKEMAKGTVEIGFAVVPAFGQNADFWSDLNTRSDPDWADTLDYFGLDFYPDVFGPLSLSKKYGRPLPTSCVHSASATFRKPAFLPRSRFTSLKTAGPLARTARISASAGSRRGGPHDC